MLTEAGLLQVIGLIDTAVALWTEHEQDEQDLFALREHLKDMTPEQKLAFLQTRSEGLQARADELRDR